MRSLTSEEVEYLRYGLKRSKCWDCIDPTSILGENDPVMVRLEKRGLLLDLEDSCCLCGEPDGGSMTTTALGKLALMCHFAATTLSIEVR